MTAPSTCPGLFWVDVGGGEKHGEAGQWEAWESLSLGEDGVVGLLAELSERSLQSASAYVGSSWLPSC